MLCKTLSIVVFFVLTFVQADAQAIFAEIPFGQARIDDVDAIASGDSILFSFQEQSLSGPVLHKRWVHNGRMSNEIGVPHPVAIVHATSDRFCYYTIEQVKGATALKCFQAIANGAVKALPPLSLQEGILLGAYLDENLFVVIYQRDLNVISVYEVNEGILVKEQNYPVPSDFRIWIRKESNIEFIEQSNPHANTFKGYSRVKLIHQEDLYLVLDNHMKNETLIIVLRKDGLLNEYRYPINSTDDFGSYIIDSKVFTSIMSNKKFVLTVHDLASQKLIATKVIEKKTEDIEVLARSAQYKTVSKETLDAMMRVVGYGDPQLTVSGVSGKYLITWGSFINDKGAGGVGGANPVAMLMSFAVSTVIRQMSEAPGISRQFFYTFDESNLQFSPPAQAELFPRNKLDAYEIDLMKQGVKVKSKNYLPFKKGILAIYNLPKEGVVRMVVVE